MGGLMVKIMLFSQFGGEWVSEMDSECHFAPDRMSRMSRSISGSPKCDMFDVFLLNNNTFASLGEKNVFANSNSVFLV